MNLIFGLLWQDEVIRENPVARVKVPKVETDKRERSVLTDAELVRYLGWQHPEEHHGMAVLKRQTMACISRRFGGLRTGDMHALRWESLDATDGCFDFGWAPPADSRPVGTGGEAGHGVALSGAARGARWERAEDRR
jgi:hypothetical protein